MTYCALAHGAQGILFFSYWPQGGRTWTEAGVLARELHRLTPFLVASEEEAVVTASDKAVHTRCIKAGKSGIVIAVNTDQTFRSATLTLPKVEAARLDLPFENRTIPVKDRTFSDRFNALRGPRLPVGRDASNVGGSAKDWVFLLQAPANRR